MPTAFEEIYELFLSDINSRKLASLPQEIFELTLEKFLLKSVADFSVCENAQNYDKDTSSFPNGLSLKEKTIISELMVIHYLTPVLLTDNLFENYFTPKEISTFSSANLIKELRITRDELQLEVQTKINNYAMKKGFNCKDDKECNFPKMRIRRRS